MAAVYAEYAPGVVLRPYVECYWSRASPPSREPAPLHRVLPDGCIDIVFNFGDSWARSAVVGTMTRPLLVEPGSRQDFLGVRFRPGQAHRFLQLAASEITDGSTALADVWGGRGPELEGRLVDCHQMTQRRRLLEEELLRRLANDAVGDARVDAAVRIALRGRGAVSVRELSAACELTRQHLARKFAAYVGISPKTFCRVIRFRALLRRLRQQPRAAWASAAVEFGYYDQAHLIADFKQFSGLAPTAFFAAG